jgi:hypothetical protein
MGKVWRQTFDKKKTITWILYFNLVVWGWYIAVWAFLLAWCKTEKTFSYLVAVSWRTTSQSLKIVITCARSGGYAIIRCVWVREWVHMKPRALNNSKNTVCTLMKFSTNVHNNSSNKPINFGNDPLSSS